MAAGELMRPVEVSVISPLFNEEESLGPLHAALVAALEPAGYAFELLLVDDGSRDRTFAAACAIARQDPRVRVVRLRRNFGQTAAMAAGFRLARGRVLVTIDGDLQNDPADIPRLLEKIAGGADVVCGRRIRREDPYLTRRLPSMLANRLISLAAGARIHDNGCTLRAYRPGALQGVPLYSEMHRLLPAIAALSGSRVT
jgi:glycosyltransferase involved in cell wall biosynthesis